MKSKKMRKKSYLRKWGCRVLMLISALLTVIFLFSLAAKPLESNSKNLPDNITCTDILGKKVEFPGKNSNITLLLFFDPEVTSQKCPLAYAQVLYKKYELQGLSIIGISSKDRKVLAELFTWGKFAFPFIHDPSKTIYERFNIEDCCGGTVLMNAQGNIVFSTSSLLNNESLRQIIEKKLLGRIVYEFKVPSLNQMFRLNQKIPDIPLIEVLSNKIKHIDDFTEDYILVTFFSSMCSVCKSGKRIDTLRAI
ncbi:MAG: redoxin domain-containing protein, partial [Acidobacteria bacterium]|nr:redoxin domain-containing protein [Acidobacteriota bacterium]